PAGEPVWHRVMTDLKRVHFSRQPELMANFEADARDLKNLSASLRFVAHQADSPWGRATNLSLDTRWIPQSGSNDSVRAEVRLTASDAHTRWAEAETLEMETKLEPSWTHLFPSNASVSLKIKLARTPW